MLNLTKNIKKIIQRHNENTAIICNLINNYSLSCVSESLLNSQNSGGRTLVKGNSHLMKLFKRRTLQGIISVCSGITSRNNTCFGLKRTYMILLNVEKTLKDYLENVNYFTLPNGIRRLHTKCNLQDKSSKQTQRKNIKEETKEELEEHWGGPEAYKLIIFLKNDFDDVINRHPEILVFFSASWCPHCLKLRKPYGRTALMAKQANLAVFFATFDVNINPDIADEKGVVGIPMIKYYKLGKFISNYRGKRTAEDLFEFVKNLPEPQSESKKADV